MCSVYSSSEARERFGRRQYEARFLTEHLSHLEGTICTMRSSKNVQQASRAFTKLRNVFYAMLFMTLSKREPEYTPFSLTSVVELKGAKLI